jgi:hypothetical protein
MYTYSRDDGGKPVSHDGQEFGAAWVSAFGEGDLHLPCETTFPAQWRHNIPEGVGTGGVAYWGSS